MSQYWYCYLILFIALFILWRQKRNWKRRRAAQVHRRKGGKPIMEALILKYMNQTIQVTTVNDTQVGTATAYADGWLTLEDKKGRPTHINADYIIQIKPV